MEDILTHKTKQQLVFVLSEHPVWGIIFEPYIVDLTTGGEFSLSYRRITMQTIHDYGVIFPDSHLELIKIMDEYHDEYLVKKFSKEKIKPLEFYRKAQSKHLLDLIRSYIEKRLLSCLNLLVEKNIPLYFKGRKKNAISNRIIEIVHDSVVVIFNFSRNREGTRYFLTIKHKDRNISLLKKEIFFIINKPCWIYMENKIFRFTGEVDSNKLIPFIEKPYIFVPKASEKKYYETFVLNSIRQFNVHVEGFQVREIAVEGTPILKFERNLLDCPALLLYFKYDEAIFLSDDKTNSEIIFSHENDQFSFVKICRNFPWEEEQKAKLLNMGLVNRDGAIYSLPQQCYDNVSFENRIFLLLTWINRNQNLLKRQNFEVVQYEAFGRYFTGSIELQLTIEGTKDWFDVHAIVAFGDYKIPFIKLKNHILTGNREYKLPNGEVAIIPEEWFAKYKDLLRYGKSEGDHLMLRKHHFTVLNNLDVHGGTQDIGRDYAQLLDHANITLCPVPEDIRATLRPYQVEGFSWMKHLQKHQLGGCLADDMGLGKTIQVLALLLKNKKELQQQMQQKRQANESAIDVMEYPRQTSLIIMPLSLIHNWENEVKKFTPELQVYKHLGIKRVDSPQIFACYDIVLTSYGVVRQDYEFMKSFPFFYIILDESQAIKNPDSKIFHSIQALNASHRLVLTGTPIENSLTDLWSQMSFLNNGILGSLNFYKQYFVNPIEKNKDEQRQKELHKIIRPFILRRTKQYVAKELPPVTTKIYYCEMSDEQKRVYEEQKSAIRNLILENLEKFGKERSSFVILNGLMKLRQLANHPKLADAEYSGDSGKFSDVINCIEKLLSEHHKVLIFSSFVKHLNLFKKYFDEKRIDYAMLTGETTNEQRQSEIDAFQHNSDKKIFLISMRAGGIGLNLTSADYVFILDPWWNPAVENQAINRTHRIGQKKSIFAYKFISTDSIEEKILKLQEEKLQLANELIDNKNPFKNFTEDEIRMLFE